MELQGSQKFNDYQQAIASLPKGYVLIDEEFLARYEVEIEAIKEFLSDKGGLHLIQVDEYSTLCRVPSKEMLSKVNERSKKLDPIEADIDFVNRCLLYPSAETFSGWIGGGAPGLAASISRKIFELAKLNQEAVSKKL
ncbi:hypothetical protein QMM42_17790 [Leptospira santarosai]|uniref:LIC_10177 family protein n=1 Tax=Leptospira TaxID=171 RepID=UPI00029256CD|nr:MULTISPECIES: hypothetical protein [Leptospira]EKO77693.1 hypothetical protein LEP1GSC068_2983 [Leptospira sp. Fiocruz LV3954]EMI65325.1 hypothetical protein LEP1GSC076_1675 [Leptospira sp. Fiocruz LV4135]MBW9233587.1 hypothetical protein [Leptospira santarosai]MDI7188023.1 hypothetical protein [Leptospira santarosai]MDI7219382.1 hypothetical protein [Leptospira santarosai]